MAEKIAWIWTEEGNPSLWHFFGNQPQYNPSTRKWRLVGPSPELHWVHEGQRVASKIAINAAGVFELAQDTPETKLNLEMNRERAKLLRETAKKKQVEERLAKKAVKVDELPRSKKATPAKLDLGFAQESGNPEETPGRSFQFARKLNPEEIQTRFRSQLQTSVPDELAPFKNRLKQIVPETDPGLTDAAVQLLIRICDQRLKIKHPEQLRNWAALELQGWLKADAVDWELGKAPEIVRESPLAPLEKLVIGRLKKVV